MTNDRQDNGFTDLWNFPRVALRHTLTKVDVQTLGRVSLVSRSWAGAVRDVTDDSSFWAHFAKKNILPCVQVGESGAGNDAGESLDWGKLSRNWCTGTPAEVLTTEKLHGSTRENPGSMKGRVNGVILNNCSNGMWAWSVGNDGAIVAVDLETATCVSRALLAHGAPAQAVAVAKGGSSSAGVVCTVGSDRMLKIWDPRCMGYDQSAYPEASIQAHMDEIYCVAIVHDSDTQQILTGGADESIGRWDLRNLSEPVVTYEGHCGTVFCLAPHDEKGVLYSGAGDRNISRFDLETGEWLTSMTGHLGDVYSLIIGTDRLLSGGDDGTIREWLLAGNDDAPEEQIPLATLSVRLTLPDGSTSKTSVTEIRGLGKAPEGFIASTWGGSIMVAQRFGALRTLGKGLCKGEQEYHPVTCLDACDRAVINGFDNGCLRLMRMG